MLMNSNFLKWFFLYLSRYPIFMWVALLYVLLILYPCNEAFCLILILLQHKSSKIDEMGAIKVAGWRSGTLYFIYCLKWLLFRVWRGFPLNHCQFFWGNTRIILIYLVLSCYLYVFTHTLCFTLIYEWSFGNKIIFLWVELGVHSHFYFVFVYKFETILNVFFH